LLPGRKKPRDSVAPPLHSKKFPNPLDSVTMLRYNRVVTKHCYNSLYTDLKKEVCAHGARKGDAALKKETHEKRTAQKGRETPWI